MLPVVGHSTVAVVVCTPLGRWGQWLALGRETLSSNGGPCTLPGQLTPIVGPLAVVRCAGSWEGGGIDLHLLTGPLASAVAHTHPWSLCRQCPAACEYTEKEAPMVGQPPPHVPPNSSGALPLWWAQASSWTSSVVVHYTVAPSGLSSLSQPQSSPQSLTSEARASVPSPHPSQQVSRQASRAGECQSA